MRQKLRVLSAVSVLTVLAAGCGYLWSPKEQALFKDAGLVVQYLPQNASGAVQFSMGPYKGGTAVLGDQHTAFWVKDGVPYAVTKAAREAATDMAQAPDSIPYNDEFIAAAEAE